jgi:Ca-activated chloride channel family protein
VDAGDIGAGHTVTALYEINLVGSDFQRLPSHRYNHSSAKREKSFAYTDELAHLRIRYKLPGEGQSKLIQTPILANGFQDQNEQGSDDFRFAAAVAAFAQKLRGGKYLESYSYSDIRQLASQSRGEDPFAYRGEFLQLVSLADSLTPPDTTTPEELAMDR